MDSTDCIDEISEFIESVKRELYHNKAIDSYVILELSKNDVFDKTLLKNCNEYGKIHHGQSSKSLGKCVLNKINSKYVIDELRKNHHVETRHHNYKYINNGFDHKAHGKHYFSFISVDLSLRDRIKILFGGT